MKLSDQQAHSSTKVMALSGGVGGAKLALGLSHLLAPEQLTVIANTGDDFEHLGLKICPDLDTLMYTLGGINNQTQGWGLAEESWQCLSAIERLGGPNWFQLGDMDIATHILRTDKLNQGQSLSTVTSHLCQQLNIQHKILPMTDDRVSTKVKTQDGVLDFQHYFVRERCQPAVSGFYFEGIEQARPQQEFSQLLNNDELNAIIICPSNPFVSVDPILQLKDVRQTLSQHSAPVIAVSPIIAGAAVKGPTAKMMQELNIPSSAFEVAKYYGDLLDGFIIDTSDADQAEAISQLGINVITTSIMMKNLDDKKELAQAALDFAGMLKTQELSI